MFITIFAWVSMCRLFNYCFSRKCYVHAFFSWWIIWIVTISVAKLIRKLLYKFEEVYQGPFTLLVACSYGGRRSRFAVIFLLRFYCVLVRTQAWIRISWNTLLWRVKTSYLHRKPCCTQNTGLSHYFLCW